MISRALTRLTAVLDPAESVDERAMDIQRVSAMLLVEIARSDHVIDSSEQQAIVKALGSASTMDVEEIHELVSEVISEVDASLSLHEHVSLINAHLGKAEKIALIEQMWKVADADGDIDRYEEYAIRKLSDLFHVKHRDFIQAKLRALDKQANK